MAQVAKDALLHVVVDALQLSVTAGITLYLGFDVLPVAKVMAAVVKVVAMVTVGVGGG